jgi:membrane protein DedA with SNARE-associated domain
VIPGLQEFFSNLTYAVGLNNPLGLGLLYLMGVLTDIGIPLLFTLEIFLLFASYDTGPLSTQVILIVVMLLLGRESGASILYWISLTLGEPFLHWLQKHFPWLLRGIRQLRTRVQQRTTLMVVIVRLTPGFLQIPSFIAGSLRLPYIKFASGVAISSLIYDLGLVIFGFVASLVLKNARQELQGLFILTFIVLVIGAWLVLFFGFHHIFDEKNGKK